MYETKFIFIAAMNPCPCGIYFQVEKSVDVMNLKFKDIKID